MNKLKIFPKTFLYTFALMLFIVVLAFGLTYLFAIQRAADELPIYLSMSDGTAREINTALKQSAITSIIVNAFPLSLLCCVFVSLICSILYSKIFTVPIKHISSVTEKMARLEKTAASDIHSGDEIGILSKNINELYQSLLVTIDNLEAEKEKVREAEKEKVDFLRAASHELKTPVTAVNAMLENMILGVGKYQNHDEYLLKCKEQTEQLHVMIRNILDTSKLGMIMESEENVDTDIADMIDDLCSSYRMIAKAKGIEFELDLSYGFMMNTKPKLLEKAIANVISNAVSYTDAGNTVTVFFNETTIVVENGCTPIPQEHLVRIFEPFYRPEYARNRDTGGNGLGLYITATILDALDIGYKFEPTENGQGMRFSINV